jgi:hypothetical protein
MTGSNLASVLRDAVNGDPALVHRGRHLCVTFLLEVGEAPYYVTVERGRIAKVDEGWAPMRQWRFAVRADGAAWQRFWEAEPQPGFHDIFAMTKAGRAVIEGDIRLVMAHLRYLKEVLASRRGRDGGADA